VAVCGPTVTFGTEVRNVNWLGYVWLLCYKAMAWFKPRVYKLRPTY